MNSKSDQRPPSALDQEDGVSDDFLVTSLVSGDEAALRRLMARYDRLVRYTIFRLSRARARSDPQWLDSIASAAWAGFVQSVRRDRANPPALITSFLVKIAHNQAISALRRSNPTIARESAGETLESASRDAYFTQEPAEQVERLEFLERLRACVSLLPDDDRTLTEHLPAIMDRRWRDAATALGLAESTLRSRWDRVLERLRACMRRKTGDFFAPNRSEDDVSDSR